MNAKKRWLALVLAIMLMISCLPVLAMAEETETTLPAETVETAEEAVETTEEATEAIEETTEITEEAAEETVEETITVETITVFKEKAEIIEQGYAIYFSSFEELQEIASQNYSDYKLALYIGSDELVIKKDLTIPENLDLYVMDKQCRVPSGVTLTLNEWSGFFTLVVDGTLECRNNILVVGTLTINGTVKAAGNVSIEDTTVVKGLDKIVFTSEWGGINCICYVTDTSTMKAAVEKAYASMTSDDGWAYSIEVYENAFTLTESLVLPYNCSLYVEEPLTIQSGCTLEVNNWAGLFATLRVNGTLVNNSFCDVYPDYGGKLWIDGGSCTGTGGLGVYSETLTSPESAFSGLDLSAYTVEELDLGGGSTRGWYMVPGAEEHVHSYVVVEDVAPTCIKDGYTVFGCSCGDSYIEGKVATGVHTFDNAADTTCNDCGATIENDGSNPMFRLYNPNSGEHFYTGSNTERDNLTAAGWRYEGIAWMAPLKDGSPIYRVYNPNSGDHHYTGSMDEVENLKAAGWQYEGVCWNSPATGVPVYRLYNPNADCGSHHYTTSADERDNLVSVGWQYEGIGWNGVG